MGIYPLLQNNNPPLWNVPAPGTALMYGFSFPKGGSGNLIALPLQKAAREKNHSVFLDNNMNPYADQWAFLASLTRTKDIDTFKRWH